MEEVRRAFEESSEYHCKFTDEEVIGGGAFGKVYLGKNGSTSCAIKVVRIGEDPAKCGDNSVKNDYAIIKHLHTITNDKRTMKRHFPQLFGFINSELYYVITMELLGDNLLQIMNTRNHAYTMTEIQAIGFQVACALKTLHDCGVSHGDIKLENVVLANPQTSENLTMRNPSSFHVKLIDFGSVSTESDNLNHRKGKGTPYYNAPEILFCRLRYKMEDVFAFGCFLFELYKGSPLLQGHSDVEQLLVMSRMFPFNDIKVIVHKAKKDSERCDIDKCQCHIPFMEVEEGGEDEDNEDINPDEEKDEKEKENGKGGEEEENRKREEEEKDDERVKSNRGEEKQKADDERVNDKVNNNQKKEVKRVTRKKYRVEKSVLTHGPTSGWEGIGELIDCYDSMDMLAYFDDTSKRGYSHMNLIYRCLEVHPDYRITIEECLNHEFFESAVKCVRD